MQDASRPFEANSHPKGPQVFPNIICFRKFPDDFLICSKVLIKGFYGAASETNYIHLLVRGHIRDMMARHGPTCAAAAQSRRGRGAQRGPDGDGRPVEKGMGLKLLTFKKAV